MFRLVSTVFWVYEIIVIARVIFSWVRVSPYSSPALLSLSSFTYAATEPLLRPIRRLLAPYQKRTPLDFSPLVLLVIVSVAERLVMRILLGPFSYLL